MIFNRVHNEHKIGFLFGVMCLVLFNSVFVFAGCGLDTFYYIEAPVVVNQKPSVESPYNLQTFTFSTQEAEKGIIGTEVYYKIYTDKSVLRHETDSLISRQNDLVDSLIYDLKQNYKYCLLRNNSSSSEVFVPWSGAQQNVEVKLTDYYTEEFQSQILINGSFKGIPVRDVKNKSFNFFQKGNTPNKDDKDVKFENSSTSIDEWYIAMFAVTSGHDEKWSNIYSKITYLGDISVNNQNSKN